MTNRSDSGASRGAVGDRLLDKRIHRGSLHSEVVSVVRDMIIQDELPPGSRIPEAKLCEMLGISRTPLREALHVLASEGLVTPLPRRGAVVATPTLDETKGLLLAIGAIESACAPIACANFTEDEIKHIRGLHERLLQYEKRDNRKKYYETNLAIHEAIVAAARNNFILDLHRSLSLRILRVRFFIQLPKTAWGRALSEHMKLLELVENRRGEELADLLLDHFKGAWHDYETSIPEERTNDAVSD